MQMKTTLLSVVIITCMCGCLFQPPKAAEAPQKTIDEEPSNTVQKEDIIKEDTVEESEPLPVGVMLNVPVKDPTFQDFCTTLDAAKQLGANYIRMGIAWKWIEVSPGEFNWESQSCKKIAAIEERGLILIPVFKTGKFWGTGHLNEKVFQDMSYPPADLKDTWNDYGYSTSYYTFINTFMARYKGHFPYIVIQNEANAPNFWAGTKEDYIKVLKTAYKAAHDADPQVKVADSGIASGAWGIVIALEIAEEESFDDAVTFLEHYRSKYPEKARSRKELERILTQKNALELEETVDYFFSHYNTCTDAVNLHFYEDIQMVDNVIMYIKGKMEENGYTLPLMCNEYGIRANDPSYDVEGSEHACEVAKKLVTALVSELELVIWFSASEINTDKLGLIGEEFSWRDAAFAFKNTLNLLEGSTFREKRSSTLYVFERGKEKIFFFWNSEIEVNCTGKVLVIDILGNTEEPVCDTTVVVKAGEEPYWVIIT